MDRSARAQVLSGARAAVPLTVAILPFGLVYGVAVTESTIPSWLGVAASWIVLAGAAQLSLLSLIDAGSAGLIAVGTALTINARFALYSTAIAPAFAQFPRLWRYGLPYLLTDQAASLALQHYVTERDPVRRRWWFVGAAGLFAAGWWSGTVVGVLAGGSIPDSVDIGFAVPAMFIVLVVPTVTDRASAIAAGTAAAATVVAAGLPRGLNIVTGALVGIAAARVLSRTRGGETQ